MKTKSIIVCTLLVLLSLILLFPNCYAKAANKKTKLNKTKIITGIGCTEQIELKNANGTISWSSSKRKIATVSNKGTITAKASGNTVITAKCNGKKYTCKVTVKKGNKDLEFVPIDGGYEVTSLGSSKENNIIIPRTFHTKPVIKIGDRAFMGHSELTSVKIPNGVEYIGDMAFFGCSGLTSIDLPDGLTSIGYGAFECCSSIKEIYIPGAVSTLEDFLFYKCTALKNVSIPFGIKHIGDSVFEDCSALKRLWIPGSITSIGNLAFKGCSELKDIAIPDGVLSIGDSVFMSCTNLKSVELSDSITSIGESLFFLCDKLCDVTVWKGSYADWFVFTHYPTMNITYR